MARPMSSAAHRRGPYAEPALPDSRSGPRSGAPDGTRRPKYAPRDLSRTVADRDYPLCDGGRRPTPLPRSRPCHFERRGAVKGGPPGGDTMRAVLSITVAHAGRRSPSACRRAPRTSVEETRRVPGIGSPLRADRSRSSSLAGLAPACVPTCSGARRSQGQGEAQRDHGLRRHIQRRRGDQSARAFDEAMDLMLGVRQ